MSISFVTDEIVEEFYQVSPEILGSFNLTKPPLDLYFFNESISKLRPFVKARQRLTKDQQEELLKLSSEGKIFVSRKDKSIYIKHIGRQLDLILQDKQLKESEAADAIDFAMRSRTKNVFEQPIKHHIDKLNEDIKIFVEYIFNDFMRIKSCIRRLSKSNDIVEHSVNCLYIGVGIYLNLNIDNISKKSLESIALGHILLNLGLTKIPAYIRSKKSFSREEREKYVQYPIIGAQILYRHGIRNKVAIECIVQHQERLDGSGFPGKLKGNEIGMGGKIAAVSHAFCDMLSELEEINGVSLQNLAQKLAAQPHKFSSKVCSALMNVIYNSFK